MPCTSEARSAEDGTAHWSPEGHHSHTVLSPRAASGEGSDGSDVHCRALGNGHRQGAEGPGLMTSRAEVDRRRARVSPPGMDRGLHRIPHLPYASLGPPVEGDGRKQPPQSLTEPTAA